MELSIYADIKFIVCVSKFKINRIHHWCSVEVRKSQPLGPPVPVGNEARQVSHWNGGPEGWDFLSSLNTNDQLFFLLPTAIFEPLSWISAITPG